MMKPPCGKRCLDIWFWCPFGFRETIHVLVLAATRELIGRAFCLLEADCPSVVHLMYLWGAKTIINDRTATRC